ncbi:DUF4105 domain-containing protein [Ascidiimonas aurantiaca]|uniref:lipoprotein N-acyltransferase Lnb domain-containing protein n=1 Tax=Ascidiimonas aurantiaca TaxID=1685432 RepID=UPI0030EE8812
MQKLRLSIFFLLLITSLKGQTPNDYEFSLLTCAPGEELYSIFGHSAIRLKSPAEDIVVNYGIFSFEEENFFTNFLLGKLNYRVGITDTKRFINAYRQEGREVVENKLNITAPNKKRRLITTINIDLEKKIYRYDYFANNCTTKISSLFSVDSTLFTGKNIPDTYRKGLNKSLYNQQWLRFLMNIALGMPADKKLSYKERLFLPLFYHSYLTTNDTPARLDITNRKTLKWYHGLTTPMVVITVFFLLMIISIVKQYRIHSFLYTTVFICLFTISGFILFFWFFSEHIHAKNNLNILWANPLYILLWVSGSTFKKRVMQLVIFFNLLFIVLSFFALQEIIPEIYALVLLITISIGFKYKKTFGAG